MTKLIPFILFSFLLLESPVKWFTHVDEALEQAQVEQKNVLLVFSGSDWCKPCIQLKDNVLKSSEFTNFAKDHLVLVNIDLKRDMDDVSKEEIRYRESITEKYNSKGKFPFVLLLNPKGEIEKTIAGYKGQTTSYYINQLKP